MAKKLVYTTNAPAATTDYAAADGTWKTMGGGGGGGTVTSITAVSPLTGGTITTSGSIGINAAGVASSGYLSSGDWNTFNNKQTAVSLTTSGTSGAATFNPTTGALNIPVYAGSSTSSSIQLVPGSASGLGAGLTRYGVLPGTTAEPQVRIPVPEACTINRMYIRTGATMPTNSSLQVTLFKNGAATAVTITVSAGTVSGVYSDLSNSATYAAGDGYTLEYKNTGTATAAACSGIGFKVTI